MTVQGNTPAEINTVILNLQKQIDELKARIKALEGKQ